MILSADIQDTENTKSYAVFRNTTTFIKHLDHAVLDLTHFELVKYNIASYCHSLFTINPLAYINPTLTGPTATEYCAYRHSNYLTPTSFSPLYCCYGKVIPKMPIFRDIGALHSGKYRRFRSAHCLHHHSTFETSFSVY
jgi:hypothetical protein